MYYNVVQIDKNVLGSVNLCAEMKQQMKSKLEEMKQEFSDCLEYI